jgi:hypothetical protein
MCLGPVRDLAHTSHARAVGAAVKVTICLYAVADHFDAAVLADGSKGMYGALKAVEGVRVSPRHTDFERLIVLIAADFALGHLRTPFPNREILYFYGNYPDTVWDKRPTHAVKWAVCTNHRRAGREEVRSGPSILEDVSLRQQLP